MFGRNSYPSSADPNPFDNPWAEPAAQTQPGYSPAQEAARRLAGGAAETARNLARDERVRRVASDTGRAALEGALEGSGVFKTNRMGERKLSVFGAARAVMNPQAAAANALRRGAIDGARAAVSGVHGEAVNTLNSFSDAAPALPAAPVAEADPWSATTTTNQEADPWSATTTTNQEADLWNVSTPAPVSFDQNVWDTPAPGPATAPGGQSEYDPWAAQSPASSSPAHAPMPVQQAPTASFDPNNPWAGV